MLLTDYNQKAALDAALDRVRRSTGIDNYTSSSKIKTMIESLNLDMLLFVDQMADYINGLHEETASGENLDLLGSKLKVYRNPLRTIEITSADEALEIVPVEDANPFSSLISDPVTIYAGEETQISDGVSLVFSEDVTITSGSSDLYFSAQIISDGSSGFSFETNDIIKITGSMLGLGSIQPFIAIKILKPLSLSAEDNSDESYRSRILLKKNSESDIAIEEAIRNSLRQLPGNIEFAVYSNSGGSGKVDIYIVTEKEKISEVDPNSGAILRLAKNEMRKVVAHGIDYSVSTPSEMEAVITYEYTSDIDIDPDTIIAAIYRGFYLYYTYDENNVIDMSDIESYVKESISSIITFNIYDVVFYNAEISEFVSYGSNEIRLPQGTYMTLLKENISELV